jgi:hypothetical protein
LARSSQRLLGLKSVTASPSSVRKRFGVYGLSAAPTDDPAMSSAKQLAAALSLPKPTRFDGVQIQSFRRERFASSHRPAIVRGIDPIYSSAPLDVRFGAAAIAR